MRCVRLAPISTFGGVPFRCIRLALRAIFVNLCTQEKLVFSKDQSLEQKNSSWKRGDLQELECGASRRQIDRALGHEHPKPPRHVEL